MMHVSTDYLVYPLHVIPQLFQVLNVPITDLADDKVALALALARLPGLHGLLGPGGGTGLLAGARPGVVSTWQWSY